MNLKDIKVGDYLYYTERPYSNCADSLVHIRDINGILMAHPISVNWNNKYINETSDNWGTDIPISSSFDEKCWFPANYTGGDAAEWMTKNYPLINMPASLHPLVSWWRKHSGWSHGEDSPSEGMSEGQLCEDTWNAAIDAVITCIAENGNPMVALERIKRLRYEPANKEIDHK